MNPAHPEQLTLLILFLLTNFQAGFGLQRGCTSIPRTGSAAASGAGQPTPKIHQGFRKLGSDPVTGATPGRSSGSTARTDDPREHRDVLAAGEGESVAEILPEAKAQLGAGICQTEQGIAAIAAGIAASAAADLPPGHLTADVVLGTVGVQRDLWPVEHHQQPGFVGAQSLEQAIKGGEAGASAKNAIEARR